MRQYSRSIITSQIHLLAFHCQAMDLHCSVSQTGFQPNRFVSNMPWLDLQPKSLGSWEQQNAWILWHGLDLSCPHFSFDPMMFESNKDCGNLAALWSPDVVPRFCWWFAAPPTTERKFIFSQIQKSVFYLATWRNYYCYSMFNYKGNVTTKRSITACCWRINHQRF